MVAALLLFGGASVGGSEAANAASPSTGTVSMSWPVLYAEQNIPTKQIAVNRRGGSSGAASVRCSTSNGTAIAGRDYTAIDRVITWTSGDSADQACNATINNATPFTGSRTFYVNLSDPTGAPLGANSRTTVTIFGDKGAGLVSLSASTYSAAQNAGSVTITVDRADGDSGQATVNYATANGSAIAGTNYTSTHGVLRWLNNDLAPKTFVIPISKATSFTGSKTLAVAIAGPAGASLGSTKSAIVTINGSSAASKPSVSLSASPASVASGGNTTLTWSASNATACSASGAWSGSMATQGSQSTGAITATKTYALNCSGTGGTASQSTTVTVAAGAPSTSTSPSAGISCTGTKGPLTLNARVVRETGISPFLVFFDATATTDTSVPSGSSAFQSVYYKWDFGDFGASGTGNWAYGSNPGHNSKNSATGAVAAHLYLTPGSDTAYVATVTAYDGTNTASCQLGVTAYDPAGTNGFHAAATTCVAAASTPVAGAGGCPAGATVMKQSSIATVLSSSLSGKRVLFKCGDSFTGSANVSGTKWSIGAYGGCEGTQTNRPIINNAGSAATIGIAATDGDGRVSDIDFESNDTAFGAVAGAFNTSKIPYQITMWNLNSNGNKGAYSWNWGAQFGVIGSVQTNVDPQYIATFANIAENNPSAWSGNVYNNLDYQALIGNYFKGPGCCGSGAGVESVRISAGRMIVVTDSTFLDANNTGAVLKIHNGNYGSVATWSGVWTEYVEVSDNYFGGNSGGNLVETAPQANIYDERLRYIVLERNLYTGSTQAFGGRQMSISGQNETFRNNALVMNAADSKHFPIYGVQVAQLGAIDIPSQYNEVYNNTCYAPTSQSGQTCVSFNSIGDAGPALYSIAKNNLFYNPGNSGTTMLNTGTANTLTNNTSAVTANPGFTNASGSFSLISDFKPTANYGPGVSVPNFYDALGTAWQPTWDLGAIHH